MLTLHGCPNTRSLRAAWALEEAGAGYDYVLVDLFKGAGRASGHLAIHPGGKVPALVVDGEPLTESGAILCWIAERWPQAGLLPPADAPLARAQALRWLFFGLAELEQPLWTIAKHRFALPEAKRVPAIEPSARWEFARAADLLAQRLEQSPYLGGERFGIADIVATHCLAWARSARIDLADATLDDYLERNWARPAALRAREREAAAKAATAQP